MPRLDAGQSCVLLLLLTVAAFAPLWHNEFVVSDDASYITGNEHVLRGSRATASPGRGRHFTGITGNR